MNQSALTDQVIQLTQYCRFDTGCVKEDYIKFFQKMDAIKNAKTHFLKTGEILPIVREPVAETWKLCVAQGMHSEAPHCQKILPQPEFAQLYQQNKFLVDVSSAVIKTICNTIKRADFSMLLFAESGHVLYIDDDNASDSLPKFQLGYYALPFKGSVSMALAYKMNFSLYGPEHFLAVYENLNCDSALIHSDDGKIIGGINVLYHMTAINTLLPSIAATTAELIEQRLINDSYASIINQTLDSISEGALIVDAGLNMIKANKRFLDLIGEKTLSRIDVKTLFKEVDFDRIITSGKPETAISEIMLSHNANYYRLNINISAIYSGNYFKGFVILCREIKDIINLSQKFKERPLFEFSSIITQDKRMLELIHNCAKIASTDVAVLLEGESGTGKELFAQSIHNASPRRNKPFIAVNCAALPVNLVESELFGYEKGAFTGALSTGSVGKFEQADGGTIFLDEIGELPLDIQAKLLRVLDNNRLTRIGGTKEKRLNIRVIAATNRDLYHEVKLKNFREDLYYRLNVIKFRIPPLKDRSGDVALLTRHFLANLNRGSKVTKRIDEKAIGALNTWEWTGNVRELQNAVTRAYHLCENDVITSEYLPAYLVERPRVTAAQAKLIPNYLVKMSDTERDIILEALNACNGKIKEAAAHLDIPLSTLYKKVKRYHITNKSESYH
jgi:transcriptional regulator with PAS, ATPase and Fis domain